MVNTIGILPALGEQAIIGEYSVRIIRRFEGRDGIGFEAQLKRNGKTVADVSQHGDGGGTWARFINSEEDKAFQAYVALYTWTWGHEFGEAFPYNEESVLDLLAFEAIESKRMNASKRTFIKKNGVVYEYGLSITKGATELDKVFSKVVDKGDQFWNKEEWVTVV